MYCVGRGTAGDNNKEDNMNRNELHTLPVVSLRNLYRITRANVCKRDGITVAEFDADTADRAANLIQWEKGPAMVSVAVDDYLSAFRTRTFQASPESLAWDSFSGNTINTTERVAPAMRALMAQALAA
jgi:hypothetical protein